MPASYRGSGPRLERLAFAIGIKPALRIQVEGSQAEAAAARWRAKGLAVRVERTLLYVARDEASAEALAEAERPVLPWASRGAPEADVLAAHRELARGLGYPGCCVDGFLERLARGVTVRLDGSESTEHVVAVEAALARSSEVRGRLSFLLPKREALVPFDPCAFDCAPALRYASAVLEAYRAREPEAGERLAQRLVEPVRVAPDLEVRFDGL